MADQVSLPNIRSPDIGGFLRAGLWTGARRDLLRGDRHEQFRICEVVSRLLLRYRLLQQLALVDVAVQHPIALDSIGGEARELRLGDDMDVEQHAGETVAGEMSRQAL